MRFLRILAAVALAASVGCATERSPLELQFDKFTLGNGLNVVLHEDRSDPIVAVAVLYHVGSNREEPGRTGFAHLFEHMMFQSSQHVSEDQFFKKIQGAGGTLNGGTGNDNTTYFEVVPKNALEMVLWLESDRMGYLLPTVTHEAFLNQQDVVQNEKRQRVDNVPYGHTGYVVGKLLYPKDHPYNWTVIGSFADLSQATIPDIHDFFKKWYGPNNATLVVAGDFDVAETKGWIEKYFGELSSPESEPDPAPRPVTLTSTKRAFHEDNFARSPELNMVFPTVEQYHPDAYPLRFLGLLLADGKRAPLYKTLVEEKKLAPSASAFQRSQEVAGTFRFRVRTFPGKSLTDVEAAIQEALGRFEAEGFTERDVSRIKAQLETGFYNGISSILGKAFQLASYNEFTGSPGYITKDLENLLAVSSDNVWRVYNQYVKGKNYVLTSFVPKGQHKLVAENSELFPVVEEAIASAGVAGKGHDAQAEAATQALPSSFDRSVEPAKGPAPEITVPAVWTHSFDNGLKLYGIEQHELPLVQFSLVLKGGMLLDDIKRVGVANLMTDIMMEGTKNRTPMELEQAIDELGANLRMFTGRESITIQGNTLRSKLDAVYGLFEEILLEPRWDEQEFDRIKRETVESINRRFANPSAVATSVFNQLLYGRDHILSNTTSGTAETVTSLTIDDVKQYYASNYSPSASHIAIAGDITKDEAIRLFQPLETKWEAKTVKFPLYADPPAIRKSAVYFVDVPRAKQSQIRIGNLALSYTDPDYFAATVMNYQLGGSFNGRVNMILREEKGYTYGARSRFSGSQYPGPFTASSGVRSNVTLESVEIFKDELESYPSGITEEDLSFTKSALLQSYARRFETLGALRGMLNQIATYDLPLDYVKDQESIVRNMTLEVDRQLADTYLNPERMIYLVVGDAKTQLTRLRQLGLGNPILLDSKGNPVRH